MQQRIKRMQVKIRVLIVKRLLSVHKCGAFMDKEKEKDDSEIIKTTKPPFIAGKSQ